MAFDNLQDKITKTIRNLQGKGKLSENNMEETLKDIRVALLEADVNYKVVKDFLNKIKDQALGQDVLNAVEPGQMLVKIVNDELINLLGDTNVGINYQEDDLTVLMMIGLQGTGKTTTLGKIAKLIKIKQNRKPLLVACDLQRPAAVEQLKTLGKSIGVEVFSLGLEISTLETALRAKDYALANGYDTLLIDTAGRLQIDQLLMEELKQLKANLNPHDILLTVDALTGQDIINVAKTFNDDLKISGLVVTKFDGDAKGGGLLSVKSIADVPVKFVGTGEKIDDIEIFYPDRYASRILGMGDIVSLVEKAQEEVDIKQAEKDAEKFIKGQFTLDDLLRQIEQTQKMGPLQSLIKMIPGMGDMAKALDGVDTEAQFKKTKAIIQSMTAYEKTYPEELRNSHKRRISAGSGTTVNDVNKLINQFTRTKKMMKSMGGILSNKFNDDE
ncbi:MAG: signal recognition particle protein [Erysipelotrichaceae bacterium]|nr:signal recognition particle protein [Erysipelotrichaceae bacterium]